MSNLSLPQFDLFEPIDHAKDISFFLVGSVKEKARVLLWVKKKSDSENELKSPLVPIEAQFIRINLHEHLMYLKVMQMVNAEYLKSDQDIICNVFSSQNNMFFKSKINPQREMLLEISIPHKIFKVQRRENFRYYIPEKQSFYVSFKNPKNEQETFRRKILNLSAGGLAFIAERGDKRLLKVGVLLNIEFSIKSRCMMSQAEVKHVNLISLCAHANLSLEPNQEEVGVLFKNITANDLMWLSGYVLDMSTQYFLKYF